METQSDQLSAVVRPSDVKEAECGATQDFDALQELISTLKELLKSMERVVELEKQQFIDLDATLYAREAMNAAHNDQLAALG